MVSKTNKSSPPAMIHWRNLMVNEQLTSSDIISLSLRPLNPREEYDWRNRESASNGGDATKMLPVRLRRFASIVYLKNSDMLLALAAAPG
jgi:hypothetical protein